MSALIGFVMVHSQFIPRFVFVLAHRGDEDGEDIMRWGLPPTTSNRAVHAGIVMSSGDQICEEPKRVAGLRAVDGRSATNGLRTSLSRARLADASSAVSR
jgi:hypothetical protein